MLIVMPTDSGGLAPPASLRGAGRIAISLVAGALGSELVEAVRRSRRGRRLSRVFRALVAHHDHRHIVVRRRLAAERPDVGEERVDDRLRLFRAVMLDAREQALVGEFLAGGRSSPR